MNEQLHPSFNQETNDNLKGVRKQNKGVYLTSRTTFHDFLFVRVSCGIKMYKVFCDSEEKPSYIFHFLSFKRCVKSNIKLFSKFILINEKLTKEV